MQHLKLEGLARLVDEGATPEEALHLGQCAECRAELEALVEQTQALADLPDVAPPPSAWPLLQRRLAAEGLVAGGTGAGRSWLRPLAAAAAALLLFAAGGVAGASLSGGAGAPGGAAVAAAPAAAETPEEAAERVREAESRYLEALTRYAELTGSEEGMDPANRLAALEGIVLTTRAALQETPADPLINGYHLAALSQRDAMLRQISQTGGAEWF